MDPEGLSILICVILALGALLALYSAGGILAADGEREKVSRLGFSDRAAGAVILFCVLFGAFLWQLCDVLAPVSYTHLDVYKRQTKTVENSLYNV